MNAFDYSLSENPSVTLRLYNHSHLQSPSASDEDACQPQSSVSSDEPLRSCGGSRRMNKRLSSNPCPTCAPLIGCMQPMRTTKVSAAARNLGAQLAQKRRIDILDDDQIATPDLVLADLCAHERHERLFVQGITPVAREYLTEAELRSYTTARIGQPWLRPRRLAPGSDGRWGAGGSPCGSSDLARGWRLRRGAVPGVYGHEDTDFGSQAGRAGRGLPLRAEGVLDPTCISAVVDP